MVGSMTSSADHVTSNGRGLWVETIRRDLLAGQQVKLSGTLFLVRRARQDVGQNSGLYVKCELGDQTGWIEAVWWDAGKLGHEALEGLLATPVWTVDGTASVNRYGGRETPQIRIEMARAATGTDPLEVPGLVRRSASSEEELGEWLSETIDRIENVPISRLLKDTLGRDGLWRTQYLRAPAAVHYHHAYVGGLADHVRDMVSAGESCLVTFPRANSDLILAGILFHDVGKLDTFSTASSPQIARTGRYLDHITAGISRLSLAMDACPGFPIQIREHLLHIVASHHGQKEYGSPVLPATREAIVVNHLDRLSSLLSHFDEWGRQNSVDQFGWSIETSPWLKITLAISSPDIPDSFDGDDFEL